MTKRPSRAVKKRKRTDWKAAALRLRVEVATLTQDWNKWHAEWEHEFDNKLKLEAELSKYRLICDWACQRIEKLENGKQSLQCDLFFSRAAFTAIVEKHAQVIQQVHQLEADVLRQREELIKLRGEPAERISL